MAYGLLELPFGSLDELTPMELFWLLDAKHEKDKEFYEMTSYAMKVAFVSANTGKHIPLFEEAGGNGKTKEISQEERDNTFALLDNIFEG